VIVDGLKTSYTIGGTTAKALQFLFDANTLSTKRVQRAISPRLAVPGRSLKVVPRDFLTINAYLD
jgi:hypothetical protein